MSAAALLFLFHARFFKNLKIKSKEIIMTVTQQGDFSKEYLRERLIGAAERVGDKNLQAKAACQCLDIIVSAIMKGDPARVIKEFFIGFPDGEEITSAILNHKGKNLKQVVYAVAHTIHRTRSASAVKAVCKLASTLKGRKLRRVMIAVEEIAHWSIDPSSKIKAVCLIIPTLKGRKLWRVVRKLMVNRRRRRFVMYSAVDGAVEELMEAASRE